MIYFWSEEGKVYTSCLGTAFVSSMIPFTSSPLLECLRGGEQVQPSTTSTRLPGQKPFTDPNTINIVLKWRLSQM